MSTPDVDTMPAVNALVGGRSGHANGRRASVNNCPYCASGTLFPDGETDNAWQCRECLRVFSVKFHGHLNVGPVRRYGEKADAAPAANPAPAGREASTL